ncbi:hypothetical protein MMC26_001820 [Xylographa opegraphella]|nr:hypothetical protein [Xylographa opegraphella]
MSADHLVNKVVKRSKVDLLSRLQSAPPNQRTALLRFLLVDTANVRIKNLMHNGNPEFAMFSTSIFAPTPSVDDEARGGSIGNSVLTEAAQIFYSENDFVAEDLEDLAWFANQIEPNCHQYVKTLTLSDGAFSASAERGEDFLCAHEREVAAMLMNFSGLEHLVINLTWHAPEINCEPYAHVVFRYCEPSVLPALQAISILRPTVYSAFVTPAVRTQRIIRDHELQHYVNSKILEHRATKFYSMQTG